MSRLLSELVGANEPFFSMAIRELEQATGNPGEDVRLSVEIISSVQDSVKHLGLDPADSNGKELYAALKFHFVEADKSFRDSLGVGAEQDKTDEKAFADWYKNLNLPKTSWVIKKSTLKKLLKAQPPLAVMKALNYKSIDSLLKREPVAEIMLGIKLVETEKWLAKFSVAYKKLKPTDFETEPMTLVFLDEKKWLAAGKKFIAGRGHNIVHVKEAGAIGVLPVKKSRDGAYLTQALFILHYLQEIRIFSSLFKHRQVHRNFGPLLSDTLTHDRPNAARMVGQDIHWRLVHRHFGGSDKQWATVFEPNVQPDDFMWQPVATIMSNHHDNFSFWDGLDCCGIPAADGPVSFNVLDVARNVYGQVEYADRTSLYLRLAIWQELLVRYMAHEVLEQQVLAQLDNDIPVNETVSVSLIGGGRI